MSLKERLSRSEENEVKDAELLNVIRRSNEMGVGTGKVAVEVDMSPSGARKRLKKLEEDGKVVATPIGYSEDEDSERGTFAWSLASDVRSQPIPPELDRLGDWVHFFVGMGDYMAKVGIAVVLAGAVILLISLTAAVHDISLGMVSEDAILISALAAVPTGAGVLGFGLIIRYGAIGVEKLAVGCYLR